MQDFRKGLLSIFTQLYLARFLIVEHFTLQARVPAFRRVRAKRAGRKPALDGGILKDPYGLVFAVGAVAVAGFVVETF